MQAGEPRSPETAEPSLPTPMLTSSDFRTLEAEADWPFFVPDDPVFEGDRDAIRPLVASAATRVWCELVSAEPVDHPMLLRAPHWAASTDGQTGPTWRDTWRDACPLADDPVVQFLRATISWEEDAVVLFVVSASRAWATSWGAFLRNWRLFLYENEGPLVLCVGDAQVVAFGPTGIVRVLGRAAGAG